MKDIPFISKNYNLLKQATFLNLLFITFVFLTYWSWGKWPDLLIDFGRELNLAWQLSDGKILYRDIRHLFGPLSPILNSLIFKRFGSSLGTIYTTNLIYLFIFTGSLYFFLNKLTSALASFLCCFSFLSIFAFSQYRPIGNFNFITPYSHESVHGIYLLFFLIVSFGLYLIKKNKAHLITSGMVFGLILLTKIEIIVSALICSIYFFSALWFICNQNTLSEKIFTKHVTLFVIGISMPISGFLVYFMNYMPITETIESIFMSVKLVLENDFSTLVYYKRSLGINNIVSSIYSIMLESLYILTFLTFLFIISLLLDKVYSSKWRRYSVIILTTIMMIIVSHPINPLFFGRSLPFLLFLTFTGVIALLIRAFQRDATINEQHIRLFIFSILTIASLSLLLKMLFYSRIDHYGFYLAPFSFFVFIILTSYIIPQYFISSALSKKFYKYSISFLIIIFSLKCLSYSDFYYKLKTDSIGDEFGGIKIYNKRSHSRDFLTKYAINYIQDNIPKDSTLTVFPEGGMINFLTKLENPTSFTNFMPPEIMAFGESVVLANFRDANPDYIAIVHKDTSEYGVKYFNSENGIAAKITNWMRNNYYLVARFGNQPFTSNGFGILLLKRKEIGATN